MNTFTTATARQLDPRPMGAIHANTLNHVRSFRSAYYDHTVFVIQFRGEFDFARVASALTEKFAPGQFLSIGNVAEVAPGVIEFERLYHIGD